MPAFPSLGSILDANEIWSNALWTSGPQNFNEYQFKFKPQNGITKKLGGFSDLLQDVNTGLAVRGMANDFALNSEQSIANLAGLALQKQSLMSQCRWPWQGRLPGKSHMSSFAGIFAHPENC